MDNEKFKIGISKRLIKLPDFIQQRNYLDVILWQQLLELNNIIVKLITNQVLTQRQIKRILIEFDKTIEYIVETTPGKYHLLIFAYYQNLIDELINYSLEVEQYEVCSNLKKFQDLYLNNTETI